MFAMPRRPWGLRRRAYRHEPPWGSRQREVSVTRQLGAGALALAVSAGLTVVILSATRGKASDAATPTARAAPEEIERVAREVLSHPRYRQMAEEEWIGRILSAVSDWIQRLFGRSALAAGPVSALIRKGVVYTLVVVSLAIIGWCTWRIMQVLMVSRVISRRGEGTSPRLEADRVPTGMSAHQALSRARDLYHDGEHRSAIRYLFAAFLLGLDERGFLRYDPRRTNGEVLRLVDPGSEERSLLASAIGVFEAKWYGLEPATELEVRALADLCGLQLA